MPFQNNIQTVRSRNILLIKLSGNFRNFYRLVFSSSDPVLDLRKKNFKNLTKNAARF